MRNLVTGLVEKAERAEVRLEKLEAENSALRKENGELRLENTQLKVENQLLRDEIARLKNLPPRPPFKPSGTWTRPQMRRFTTAAVARRNLVDQN